jgi:hypothetical protein
MKRLMAMVLAVAVLAAVPVTSQACWFTDLFGVSAQSVVDFICAPTADQQADAGKMLAALDAGQAAGAMFYAPLGIVKASAVLTTIKNGGCFLVAELTEAFKVVDAANAAVQTKQLKMLPTAPATLPEYPALRKLVK